MQNYNYKVMNEVKKASQKTKPTEEPFIDVENARYKLHPVELPSGPPDDKDGNIIQRPFPQAKKMPINNKLTKGGNGMSDPNETISLERRQFVTTVIVSHCF